MKEILKNILHDLKKIAEQLQQNVDDLNKIKLDSKRIHIDINTNLEDLNRLKNACEILGNDVMKALAEKGD